MLARSAIVTPIQSGAASSPGQAGARTMLNLMLEKLPGQHVFLWTDDAEEFYKKSGFEVRDCVSLEKVVGQWLVNEPAQAIQG